jgi:cell division protease FtsH
MRYTCAGIQLDIGIAQDLVPLLQRVTAIARQMVTRWGMSGRLGTISFSERDRPFGGTPLATGSREYSEKTASMIDEEVSRIVSRAYNRAVSLMPEHRETLDAQQLRAIMEEAGVPVSALA